MSSGGARPGAGRPGGSGKGKHIFYITIAEKIEIQAFLSGLRAQGTPTQKPATALPGSVMPTDVEFEINRRDLQKAMLRGQIESIERVEKNFTVKTR